MVATSVSVVFAKVDGGQPCDITRTRIGRQLKRLANGLISICEDWQAFEDAVLDRAEEIGGHDLKVDGNVLLIFCVDLTADAEFDVQAWQEGEDLMGLSSDKNLTRNGL
ncbi:hypothetical protein [Acidisphaera sp. S103]|uniref:hypothetical protein n=1 Tax=Acidisphaera sp. S103 TaxID=1747223 RepID=UPI00131A6911|nr:hypothetical protein [Acidisphaera sp. S103]